MPNLIQVWIEVAAVATAIIAIPLYMGFIHVSVPGALGYVAVGGVAMAVGEDLQFGIWKIRLDVWDVILWSCAIMALGGLAYVLALLLI